MVWFPGKVALVSGAGSGIGRASALKFAHEGAKVIVSDIVAEGGHETVRLIREAGGEATFVKTDISQASDVEALAHQAVETYGQLNDAHNNAGLGAGGIPITELSERDFDRTISVNLKGVWLCLKYEIIQMLKQGTGGAIVNTASGAGLVGIPGASAYTASKHGVVGLTKAVAWEYASAGIRINAVCPGAINTPLLKGGSITPDEEAHYVASQAIKRLGKPEEIANAAAWLCSDEASFVPGVPMPVDAGFVAV
jgi:NAD(P)-dependent dehydrogenase (short-subunit alcohol dehydrogenase family)